MDLGRLEQVDPRAVWPGEATHFTPWLLEHADHLAEALGIDLELEEAEHRVGGFSLDLLGTDQTNDAVLIVENQLEPTDHTHLGQILTYAAGTEASTIIWIATEFREEHRQALDWLNQNTGEDVHFFGVRLGVVRIGGSAPAPLLEVVAQPNEWQKRVRAAARSGPLSGKRALYVQFWTRYLERVREEHPNWTKSRTPTSSNWITQPAGVTGTQIGLVFASGGRLSHELYIDAGDAEKNLSVLRMIEARREEFEQAYGRRLDFQDLPNARACRIADYGVGDVTKVDEHDAYIDWFIDAGVRLRRAIAAIS